MAGNKIKELKTRRLPTNEMGIDWEWGAADLGCWGWTFDEAVVEDEEDVEDVDPFLPSDVDSSTDIVLKQRLHKKQ